MIAQASVSVPPGMWTPAALIVLVLIALPLLVSAFLIVTDGRVRMRPAVVNVPIGLAVWALVIFTVWSLL